MLFNAYTSGLVAATIFGATNAHLVMNTPTPYGFSDLTTSPLDGAGNNFPCQEGTRKDWDQPAGASNPMVVGQQYPLKFTGSAVHGGGSCQLSVAYDYPPPSDPTKWKVIHTFLGGCPSNAAGNIQTMGSDKYGRPNGPQCAAGQHGECMNEYDFDLPEGVKNGNATLAWTWFNKIGNREIYMNCAPISISGGSDDDKFMDTLPTMFVANIPGYCTTGNGNLNIPNPGQYVTKGEPLDDAAIGSCKSTDGAPSSSGSSESSGSSGGSGSSGSSSTPSSSPAAPNPEVTVTTMHTVTSGSSSPATVAPVPVGTGHPSPNAPSSGGSSSSSGSSSSGGSDTTGNQVSCSSPGDIVCIGDSHWGMCDEDKMAVKMALAAGTKCSNGSITRKREVRVHAKDHLHVARHPMRVNINHIGGS